MKILFQRPDGSISILVPAEEFREPGESDEAFCTRVGYKDVPANLAWRLIDDSEIPKDRTYRAAWINSDDGIKIDQAKKAAIDAAIAKGVQP